MTPINEIPAVCNYGTSAVYSDYPNDEQLRKGVIPLDSLPAAWWNKMWCASNCAINEARDMVGQLITEINSVLAQAGVCPAAACTDQLYQSINLIRQRLATVSVAGSVLSSNEASKVAVAVDGTMSVNCLGNAASLTTSASTIVGAINELKSTYDTCFSNTATAIDGKAPTSHASSATTYGVGNADNYGHLKISDIYTSVLAACSGVAASQKALACVYAIAAAAAEGNVALGNTAGCALGTASAGTAVTAARSDHVHPKPTCVACAGANGSGTAFGSAATKAAGSAAGDVPLVGAALGTTANKIVLTNASGALVPSSSVVGSAAYCAADCFRPSTWTPSLVSCARAVWNRPGSTEASKICNVTFYAGCSNAQCVASNVAVCICGCNGRMYGLNGATLPYIYAADPGSTVSRIGNVEIYAYCTNAQGTKTTRAWTFCGCNGAMYGNVCGTASWATNATNSSKVYEANAVASLDYNILLSPRNSTDSYKQVHGNGGFHYCFDNTNCVGCVYTHGGPIINRKAQVCIDSELYKQCSSCAACCYCLSVTSMQVYPYQNDSSCVSEGNTRIRTYKFRGEYTTVCALRAQLYNIFGLTANTCYCYRNQYYCCTGEPVTGYACICGKRDYISGIFFVDCYGGPIQARNGPSTAVLSLYAECGACLLCDYPKVTEFVFTTMFTC